MKGLVFKSTYTVSSPNFSPEDRFYKVIYCGHDFNVVIEVTDSKHCVVSFSHSSPYNHFLNGDEHTFYKNFEPVGAFRVIN